VLLGVMFALGQIVPIWLGLELMRSQDGLPLAIPELDDVRGL